MGESLRAYLLLVRIGSRAAWQYRTSLILLTASQAVITAMDLAMITVLFAHTTQLAGFGFTEVLFLYGTSYVSFGIADLTIGPVDLLGERIRNGTFDAMLIRPVGTLAQVVAEDFTPRRVASALQGLVVLGVSLSLLNVPWTPGRVAMILVMVVTGAIIFGSIRVLCAAMLFLIDDAASVINAFIYGGNFLTQYPLAIYSRNVLRVLTWVVPLAFVNWQPGLYVLNRTDPFGLPATLHFVSPVVAVVLVLLAAAGWRAGVRHYLSTGN